MRTPACLPYDMTADPIGHGEAQIAVFADAQRRLLEAAVAPGSPYVRYGDAVSDLLERVESLASDVLLWVGGVSDANTHRGVDGRPGLAARRPVAAAAQRKALKLYLKLLRPQRLGLVPPPENAAYMVWAGRAHVAGHVKSFDVAGRTREAVQALLVEVLSPSTVLRLYSSEQLPAGGGDAFNCSEFLEEVVAGAVGEGLDVTDSHEWHLHRQLVRSLIDLYNYEELPEELRPRVLFQLRYLAGAVDEARRRGRDQPGWTACAKEGHECSCSGLVRYGILHTWSPARAVAGAVRCDGGTFGDPAPRHRKRCECLPAVAADDDVLHGHLLNLHRDLTEVFCNADGVPCPQPQQQQPGLGDMLLPMLLR
eukprot:SRR837773.15126.p2 GENE.SRR837773.15126~~SRR837773.15126.p2  ORF type:complete len:367 (-),score=112.71 SRR837773.15126:9-1109(-)